MIETMIHMYIKCIQSLHDSMYNYDKLHAWVQWSFLFKFWLKRVNNHQYLLNWVCILLYASNLGSVCPLVREVLVSTIPAAWGTEVSNILGTPAANNPLAICVPNACCRVSACRPRLPPVQRSWGWEPELLLSICCLEADQLLSTLLLSELLPQFLCELGALPIQYKQKTWFNSLNQFYYTLNTCTGIIQIPLLKIHFYLITDKFTKKAWPWIVSDADPWPVSVILQTGASAPSLPVIPARACPPDNHTCVIASLSLWKNHNSMPVNVAVIKSLVMY